MGCWDRSNQLYQIIFIEKLLSTMQQTRSESDVYWDLGVQVGSRAGSSKQGFSWDLLRLQYLAVSFWDSDIFTWRGRTEMIFLNFKLGCGFCCWFIKQSVFTPKRIFWESNQVLTRNLTYDWILTLSSIKPVFIFCLLGLAQHSYVNVRQKCADRWPCDGLCSKPRRLFMFRMLILFANYFGALARFVFTISENISVF